MYTKSKGNEKDLTKSWGWESKEHEVGWDIFFLNIILGPSMGETRFGSGLDLVYFLREARYAMRHCNYEIILIKLNPITQLPVSNKYFSYT